ncbi:hypothetical protein FNH08_37445 [Streptomyces spongiae]|uniref:DUF8094 domain-containing protein n=2 Tax=Streptomyces spongiae TaxID=565072 RepID=A0A5N8XTE8_9ACTN|nr:hypothetical protein [Streptomyces spongiae]
MYDDRPRRLGGHGRFALATASVAVLSVTASGCVVVHGEREIMPTATRADAARALKSFTAAYNKADKTYDQAADADQVTGALADIDGAKLRAGRKNNPDGNPAYSPLKLTDAKFTIPEKAGWPRWFVADTAANKGLKDTRWLLVFTRSDANAVWSVSYLTILNADDVPEFEKDKDGFAQTVTADDAALAIAPDKLGEEYATYLKAKGSGSSGSSGGANFAPGTHTSVWRADRVKKSNQPGLARQYIDEPLSKGDYAPLGLRTTDGGALVFFATRHYEKQTAAPGYDLDVDANIQALLTGEVKSSLTLQRVSNQVVMDPAKSASDQQVKFLSRVDGLTSVKGE